MTLTVLGSESKGNCYLLTSDTGESLILEAGIRLAEVKQALNFDLSGVVGGLLTHEHGDHFKYAESFMNAGIDVYTGKETLYNKNIFHYRSNEIDPGDVVSIGKFKVVSFDVVHNVPCLGFLISHPESGKILFVTDAAYIPHKFTGLSHILIEANYSDEAMISDRAVGHHMALSTCLDFIRGNNPHNLRNIVLLHLSATNSDAKQFIKEVKTVAPHADVAVADKGMVINLNSNPF